MKARLLLWLKIAVGVALLVALYLSGKFQFGELARVREYWVQFLLAQAAFLVLFFATMLRWYVVMRALDVPARLGDSVRLAWVGLLFSQVMLGSTGGDLVKGFYIARECPERRAEAVLSVLLDRVLGLTALMILGGVALVLNVGLFREIPELASIAWILGTLVVVILGAGALMAWERFWRQRWIQRLYLRLPGRGTIGRLANALWTVRGKRKVLVVSLILSLGVHTLNVFFHVLLAASLRGETPGIAAFFFLIPIGQLAFALPITPGGLGVGEWAYDTLFAAIHQPHGAELAILVRLTWILWALPGLVFYLRGKKELQKALRSAEENSLGPTWGGIDERKVSATP